MRLGLRMIGVVVAGCVGAAAGEPTEPDPSVLFREGFDDDRLLQRTWYDGRQFNISGGAFAGRGCIEYYWNKDAPHGLTQGPLRGGYNGKFYDSREPLFTDDKWHSVEALFKLNTLDLDRDKPHADGVVRGWFDGKLVVDHTDVVLRSTDFPKMKFNQFLLTPYFGPGLLPQEQTLWIDDLVVATERSRSR